MANKVRRAERSTIGQNNFESAPDLIETEALKPTSKVVRELRSPDGTVIRVEVPVYPPFRLKEKAAKANGGR